MRTALMKRIRWGLALFLCVTLASTVFISSSNNTEAAIVPGENGVVCTQNATSTFNLTAMDGYVTTPDGNTIYMWSYGDSSVGFQLPGPVLCVKEGDTVTVVLHNSLPEDVSIIFPGQENVLANGTLSQPVFSGSTLTSLAPVATKQGGTITYSFVAKQPGTYLYESGTDSGKQVQMGLYGAMIVRPATHPTWAYNTADSAFNPGQEYVMLLSEVDPDLHAAVELGRPYTIDQYHPAYWMINGRSFPDTIAPNNAAWLPAQPYGALVHMVANTNTNSLPSLVRFLNVGMLNHPFHPHGNNGRVIARDGQPLKSPSGQDLSYDKYLILVGSAQTWDVTYTWNDIELWKPNTNPIPVPLPQQQNQTYKGNATWYSGSPYLGVQDELPTGVTSYNQCGEFYHVWHSHALNEAANFDIGFGGMFTLQRIDPPDTPCP